MRHPIDLTSKLSARKAVILARVSSREQEEGYSIDAQKHRLEQYCMHKKLSVIRSFSITESSTNGDRRKFMEMIKFVKTQREPIAIVADKVDRVQRSFREYPLLDELINAGKIELHFNTENYIIHKHSVSQERLMWSMSVIMAQSYIDSMKDNVKRSFEQKIRIGEWIAKAPLGYLNVKRDSGKSWVATDPERALLIKRLFHEYATGAYTLSQIVEMTRAWGLKGKDGKNAYMTVSSVHQILNNPFYHGQMRIKGHLYPHNYEPLIDKATFTRCQQVLEGWHKKPFLYAGKEFVFRGLIKCATSGKVVTADEKTRRYKNGRTAQWTYLRCWNPQHPAKKQWVREDKILEQVEQIFEQLYIPPEIFDKVMAYLRQTDHIEREHRNNQIEELTAARKKIQKRRDALMELLMDDVISREDFNRKRAQLDDELYDVESLIKGHKAGDDGFKDTLINLMFLSKAAKETFTGSTVEQKRLLVNFVFANLELKGDKLLYSLNKPFDLFIEMTKNQGWLGLLHTLRTDVGVQNEINQTLIRTPSFLKALYPERFNGQQ